MSVLQATQTLSPINVLYFPETHCTHAPPFGPEAPAAHIHDNSEKLPTDDSEYFGHSEQLAFPDNGLYVPPMHSAHIPPSFPVNPLLHVHANSAGLPRGENECAGHAKQVDCAIAPVTDEYQPAAQLVQVSFPFVSLNLPSSHAKHGPPAEPVEPALQMHACGGLPAGELDRGGHTEHTDSAVAAMATENLPGAQSVHDTFPDTDLNFPAIHGEHDSTSFSVNPALHMHTVLPCAESELFLHCEHVEIEVAPTAFEYVPCPQSVQTSADAYAEKDPAAHGAQGAEPVSFLYVPMSHCAQTTDPAALILHTAVNSLCCI